MHKANYDEMIVHLQTKHSDMLTFVGNCFLSKNHVSILDLIEKEDDGGKKYEKLCKK